MYNAFKHCPKAYRQFPDKEKTIYCKIDDLPCLFPNTFSICGRVQNISQKACKYCKSNIVFNSHKDPYCNYCQIFLNENEIVRAKELKSIFKRVFSQLPKLTREEAVKWSILASPEEAFDNIRQFLKRDARKEFFRTLIFMADMIYSPYCYILSNEINLEAYKRYIDIPESIRALITKEKHISIMKNQLFRYEFIILYIEKRLL